MPLSSTGIRVDGLTSNIDYSSIISKLLSFDQRSISVYENRIKETTQKETAFLSLSAKLVSLQGTAGTMASSNLWNATKVFSSNEDVLYASGSNVSAMGSYSFSVKRMAQSNHILSSGYSDYNTTPLVSAGTKTFSIETGAGYVDRETPLSYLNGMQGIDRGSIKVTDKEGNVATIDLSGVATVQDVLDTINNSSNINVRAYAQGDRIMLEDTNTGLGTMTVENVGTDTTADDFGLTASTAGGAQRTLVGGAISFLSSSTALTLLNDGNGVRRTSDASDDFRISLRDLTANGGLGYYDINIKSTHSKLGDIKSEIETATGGNVSVTIDSTGLKLVDNTAGAGVFQVTEISGSNAALDLGLVRLDSAGAVVQISKENSASGIEDAAGNVLSGDRIWADLNGLLRRSLSGGEAAYWTDGSAANKTSVDDGTVTLTDRSGATTNAVISRRIFKASTALANVGDTTISLPDVTGLAVGSVIRITDGTNSEYKTITGISGTDVTFDGQALKNAYAAGSGFYAYNQSFADIVNVLNYQAESAGVDLTFSTNNDRNGIVVNDSSGSSAVNLQVSDAGNVVEQLFGSEINEAGSTFEGKDLEAQYISEETKLSTLNYGTGVSAGKMRIYDKDGTSFVVDLNQEAETGNVGNVITEINGAASLAGSDLKARINDTGDGIILSDSTGTGSIKVVEQDGGRTAKDLNLEGEDTGTSLDGSHEYSVTVNAGDTLKDLSDKINELGISVTASIINDGSAINPYRLSVLSKQSGLRGRITLDNDFGMSFTTAAKAQDALLLYGGNSSGSEPAFIQSATNSVKNVVAGLSLDLRSASETQVSVTIQRDSEYIVASAQKLVEQFNDTFAAIDSYTDFEEKTSQYGVLFGDSTVRSIENQLYKKINTSIIGISSSALNSLGEVGIRIGGNGKVMFDESKFLDAFENKYDEMKAMFTAKKGLEYTTKLDDFRNGLGVEYNFGKDDFKVHRRDGVDVSVGITGAETVGDVLSLINYDAENTGSLLVASLSSDGRSIVLTDNSIPTGSDALSVTSIDGSATAAELGLNKTAELADDSLQGADIDLKYDTGAANRLVDLLTGYTDSVDGLIDRKVDTLGKRVDSYNAKIEAMNKMLAAKEESLVMQFSNLEKILAQSESVNTMMQTQFANMVSSLKANVNA